VVVPSASNVGVLPQPLLLPLSRPKPGGIPAPPPRPLNPPAEPPPHGLLPWPQPWGVFWASATVPMRRSTAAAEATPARCFQKLMTDVHFCCSLVCHVHGRDGALPAPTPCSTNHKGALVVLRQARPENWPAGFWPSRLLRTTRRNTRTQSNLACMGNYAHPLWHRNGRKMFLAGQGKSVEPPSRKTVTPALPPQPAA
jgi:hypothetical protein